MSIAHLKKTFKKALWDKDADLILACLETLEREQHLDVCKEWWNEAKPVLHEIDLENEQRWPSEPVDSSWPLNINT